MTEATEGHLNAYFTATDDTGATTTQWLNRTLHDNAPSVVVQDPGNTTYWDYDVPWSISVTDGDNMPNESISCDLTNASTTFHSVTGTESFSASGGFRARLGTHTFEASCTDPAGNTGTASETFEVQAYQVQSTSGPNITYETRDPGFRVELTTGDMVTSVTTELQWGNQTVAQDSRNSTGVTTITPFLTHTDVPLVHENNTARQWRFQYTGTRTAFDGTKVTDTRSTANTTQRVRWSYWIKRNSFDPSTQRYIEGDRYQYYTTVRNRSSEASLAGQNQYNRTMTNVSLVQTSTSNTTVRFKGQQATGRLNASHSVFGTTNYVTVSFNGKSRTMQSQQGTFDLYRMELTKCNTGMNTATTTRFNLLDESNQSKTVTGQLNIRYQIWNGGVNRTYAFERDGQSSYDFCIYPAWASFQTDALMQYYADTYVDRQHYLINATLSNQTQTTPLYLLKESKASRIDFSVVNQNREPVEDVIIKLQRYYVGQDKYVTVAMSRSDYQGNAMTFARVNELYYKIFLIQNAKVVREYEPFIITSTDLTLTIDKQDPPNYFDYRNKIAYSCEYQNATESVVCSYDDTTGLAQKMCLNVSTSSVVGYQPYDQTCSTATSATLLVNTSATGNTTLRYSLYTQSPTYILATGEIEQGPGDQYGTFGVFLGLLLMVAVASLGLWSLSAAVILTVISVILANYLGFISVTLGSIAGLGFLAAYFIMTGDT